MELDCQAAKADCMCTQCVKWKEIWGLPLHEGLYCLDTDSRSFTPGFQIRATAEGEGGNCPRFRVGANDFMKTCEIRKSG